MSSLNNDIRSTQNLLTVDPRSVVEFRACSVLWNDFPIDYPISSNTGLFGVIS